MATRRSVIRSVKHIPGGARPTPAPQYGGGGNGGGANFGQLSPLTAQLATGGAQGPSWSYAYGGFLPRPTEDFTEGAFGPFSPILPVPVDAPASDQTPRAAPRRYEYQVGWNLPTGQPGKEGIKLADFQTLRTLADLYSVARACIELRKNEIRGLAWDIMPTKDAAKAMRGSDRKMKDFGQRRAEATKFFKRPDGYTPWSNWLDTLLEDVFVIDAASILLMPKWGKGKGKGLLGSDLDSLQLVDGATIRPLINMHGYPPRPPAPAYQQYLYGVPRTDLMTMALERDLDELKGLEGPEFTDMQLIYKPFTPRIWTPYGFAPIEQALVPVMSGLQKQGYQLDFFREGTVPAVYVSPGGVNSNMTPNQIRELQDALNAIAGDVAYKHKIIVLPADSHVMPQKPTEIADQFDEIVMNQVCMAFGVQPMELGILPKVSTTASPGAAHQMGKESQDIQERKSTKPTLEFLADIFNTILQDVCGQDDMQFTFEGLEEDEDEATQTGMLIEQIGAGLRSIDEARESLGMQPWGLPETQDPGWATGTGFVPLGQMDATGQAASGQQPTAQNPATAQPAGQQTARATGGAAKPKPGSGGAIGGTPAKKPSGGGTGGTPAHAASQGADTESGKTITEPDLVKFQRDAVDTGHHAAKHQARREAHLDAAEGKINTRLRKVVADYKASSIAAPQAADAAVTALGQGYQSLMDQASADAVDDGLAEVPIDLSGEAAVLAEQQRIWLTNLLKEVALGYAANLISNRLALYTASLSGAYNQAYGKTARSSGRDYQITWQLGATEHCKLCLDRAGQTYSFNSLPGWPGDGGFGGLCYGGPRCGCSLSYSEDDQTLATGYNTQRGNALPYYDQQLATIQNRRQDVLTARQDFVDSLPDGARARAMTRDQIAQQLAAAQNQAIRESGGYGGVSVEWTDVSADDIAALVPDASKARAIDAELSALARHVRKGRLVSTWEPRHVNQHLLARVSEHLARGMTIEDAIEVAKALVRRVNLDGEILEVDTPDPTVDANYPIASGGGGRVMPAHDVTGTEISAGRVPNDPEVPGGVPGSTPGGEPPRWAPPEGTSSGQTASQQTVASKPQGGQDDEYPKRRGRQQPGGGGPRGGAPTGPSIGTGQSPTSTPPGALKGNVSASVVRNLMLKNFPAKSLTWVSDATWSGPTPISMDQIDFDSENSWAAHHQDAKVDHFVQQIEDGDDPNPPVMVSVVGDGAIDKRLKVVDGHHRTLAYKKLGKPVPAYVGVVQKSDTRWEETHSSQFHQGSDPANKATKPIAAGIAIVSADSGRLLMLQRSTDDEDDPAAGLWEFPGGRAEPDDGGPFATAAREWEEETGVHLPDGEVIGSHVSPNGKYQIFIYEVQSEGMIPIFTDRDQVVNPDDPDGDHVEALAWWEPGHLRGNQAVRPEVLSGLDSLLAGLSTTK